MFKDEAAKDDETRSVRIELEGGAAPVPASPVANGEAATASKQSGGPSVWIIILAVVIVGVVGAGVLSLRPDGDAAADGTDRGTTTTTEPIDEDDAADGDAASDAEGVSAIDGVADQIVQTPLVTGGSISQMIAADIGFIALGTNGGVTPTILRSVDGEDWFDVETTVLVDGEPNTDRLDWFNFFRLGDEFAITAFADTDSNLPMSSLFVSSDGAAWVEMDFGDGASDENTPFFPVTVNEDSLFVIEFGQLGVFQDLVSATTTLELQGSGVCGIFGGPDQPAEIRYEVFDCNGSSIGFLNVGNVRPELSSDDVFSCIESLSAETGGFDQSFELVRWPLDPADERVSLGRFNPLDLPAGLSNGGVAAIDGGTFGAFEDSEVCEPFLDSPDPVDPAILVADAVSTTPTRFPLPGGSDPFEVDAFPTIAGEVTVAGGSQLIVVRGRALWALDLETGDWQGPLSSPDTPFPDGFQQRVTLSESGTRAYAIAELQLVTFDFVEAADGGLSVVETIQPIQPSSGSRVDFSGILYADDDVLFIGDGRDAWALDTPPLPNDE